MLNKTFKLQSRTIKYVTNIEEKKVTAICEFDSVLGTVKATGYAICGDSDKFNKAKGRKLARARAELNAYATYRQRLFDYQSQRYCWQAISKSIIGRRCYSNNRSFKNTELKREN